MNLLPPKAQREEYKATVFGEDRYDPYHWMKDIKNRKNRILDHLEKENAYTKRAFSPVRGLRKKLFEEMKVRMPKKEKTLPFEKGSYSYYTKYEIGSEHPILCRKNISLRVKEEILLNTNRIAKNQKHFELAHWSLNKDHNLLAYAVDFTGERGYTLFIQDVKTKRILHKITNITSNFVWSPKEPHTLLYTWKHPIHFRWEKVKALNVKTKKEKLIYHETDKKHLVSVSCSLSGEFLFIESFSKDSSEIFSLSASSPFSGSLRRFEKKKNKHQYYVEHGGSCFFVLSNRKGKNFQIFKTPDEERLSARHWKTVVPHRKDIFIVDFLVFESHLVLLVRKEGFKKIEIVPRKKGKSLKGTQSKKKTPSPSSFFLSLKEKNSSLSFENNVNYKSSFFRFSYSSLKTPSSVIDFSFQTKKKKVQKVQKVLKGFRKENYISKRLFAKNPEGERIPLSLVHHKKVKLNGKNPTLLYGYGSYGYSIDPYFSPHRLSLLKRGFVFAIAHIRGGSEKGYMWYEEGKKLKKKNSFKDFIACAEYLIQKKYTSSSSLYAMGGSAGGLLMGVVLNERPKLFSGAMAHVPFVDVVNTMLDESLPLTTEEYEEWGNPNEKKNYDYIKSYSPYDNIKAQDYPHLLITAGFYDSQVKYWEAAKWAAKLRHEKTDKNLLLLDINMKAGHSGASGRFESLKDLSRDYTFLLLLEKKRKKLLNP